MAGVEHGYYEAPSDGVDFRAVTSSPGSKSWFKVVLTLVGGSSIVLLLSSASSVSGRGSTNLVSLSPSLRSPSPLAAKHSIMSPMAPALQRSQAILQDLGVNLGSSKWKNLAMTAVAANARGNRMRDIAVNVMSEEMSDMDDKTKKDVAEVAEAVKSKAEEIQRFPPWSGKVEDMAGITAWPGLWDPLGFSTNIPAGKLLFYREVELKHGRVGMLASLGIIVAEQWHPLFGGNVDVPAYIAFQATPLQTFWPAVVAALAIPEAFSVFDFEPPEKAQWSMPVDHIPGDFNWDPLGIKPKDPEKAKRMQTMELNNGRLGMIAAAGMIAQELATGEKIFG